MTTPIRRRGRPKLKPDGAPQEKLIDKILAAVSNGSGEPTVYASTTKGSMKLIFKGHHFVYSFRKGQYSIFQCCYKEKKEQCKVRVVSDQKRVFHLDGEHVHFIQATDKSVTSLIFESGGAYEENEASKIGSKSELENTASSDIVENEVEPREFDQISEAPVSLQSFKDESNSYDAASQYELAAANCFREKIKKRLQKALLGKKK